MVLIPVEILVIFHGKEVQSYTPFLTPNMFLLSPDQEMRSSHSSIVILCLGDDMPYHLKYSEN